MQSTTDFKQLAVTGALSLSNGIFLQCLEGERSAVNALYHHILKDKRHNKPEVLALEEITQRQFDPVSIAGCAKWASRNAEPPVRLCRCQVQQNIGIVALA